MTIHEKKNCHFPSFAGFGRVSYSRLVARLSNWGFKRIFEGKSKLPSVQRRIRLSTVTHPPMHLALLRVMSFTFLILLVLVFASQLMVVPLKNSNMGRELGLGTPKKPFNGVSSQTRRMSQSLTCVTETVPICFL